MVAEDFGGVGVGMPGRGGAGQRRRIVQVATVCASAACLAALVVSAAGVQRRAVLMTDDSLDATTIGIDHNAMLQGNAQQNAAFMQTFGSYMPNQAPKLATGTTQLAQSPPKPAIKQSATARLNAKLAAQMQASLTAGTQGDSLMTPHFVAALEQATGHGPSGSQMLAQQQAAQQKATMDALSMTHSTTHILPSNMRQKFAISTTKNTLGAVHNLTPQQAAMRVSPMGDSTQSLSQATPSATGGNPASASRADNSFLNAEPPQQLTAKQLIKKAALEQMNSLPAPAPAPTAAAKPAPVQQLAQYPAQAMYAQPSQYAPIQMTYQQPLQQYAPPQPAYQPQPMYAQTQMAWQPAPNAGLQQPAMYQQPAPTQQMYQMASPVKPEPYHAPVQTQQQMMAEQPQRAYAYDPAQANVNTASPTAMMAYKPPQQLAMPQPQVQAQLAQQAPAETRSAMGAASSVGLQTPAEIGAAAANKAAAANWRAPDVSLKGAKGKISAAARRKIKEQMSALRSSILADYKKNSKMANTALLLGPGGL